VDGPATTEAPVPAGPVPRPPRLRFLVVGVILAAVLGVGLFTTVGSHASPGRPAVGQPAPSFSLPRLGGGAPVGVPDDGGGHGRPAVLLFYASTCAPCRTEIPRLAAAYRAQRAHPVALVGVAAADPSPGAFARASGVTFPVGLDSSLDVTEGRYYFTGLPEAVFVRGDGRIAGIHYGAVSTAQLAAAERHLLGA
jgi:thiol-disulfide isomerase/thioredoxin